MRFCSLIAVMVCGLAAVATGQPAQEEPKQSPECGGTNAPLPGTGPLARAGRGVVNIVISPLEIPATAARVSSEHNPFIGLFFGSMEGVGNGLMRFCAGVVELLTAPIPSSRLPLYSKKLGERALPPRRPPTGMTQL